VFAPGVTEYRQPDVRPGQYNPSNPEAEATLHFTQMVWKSTKQLGCAYVNCAPGTIFPSEYGSTPFHVCEYSPPGNYQGEFT
jgi:hypothetical protein